MWKKDYFRQYQSPNIIIVPTVNFCHNPPQPTGSEKIADPIKSSSTLNCDQLISPVKDNYGEPSASVLTGSEQIADPITSSPTLNSDQLISPVKDNYSEPSASVSLCNQQNLQFVNTKAFESTSTPQFSENFQDSPHKFEKTIPTEDSSCNMNQSIKELCTSKYRSRNNLVDLTGFNLLKRDSAGSLTKHKDFRSIDDTMIEPDKISISTKDLRNKITEENRSKKYRDLERSLIAEYPKTSKCERNSRLLHLPPDYIQRYKDYQRFMRRYDDHEIKYKSRNKLVTKSLSRKKIILKSCDTRKTKPDDKKKEDERKQSIKSEKFSEAIQNNLEKKIRITSCDNIKIKPDVKKKEDERKQSIKCEKRSEVNTIQTNLEKKIRIKSCDTGKIKPDVKKKEDERKQSIKSEKRSEVNTIQTNLEKAKNQSKTDKVLIKSSVVRVDRNPTRNLSHRFFDGVQDLRSRLSRKRTRSECIVHYHKPMENRLDRESLVTTVKQDVEANSKHSPILAPTEYEPKPKRCKPNELMNNINCPNSNSGDFDEDKLLKAEMDDRESLVTTVKQDVEANSKHSPILAPTEYEPKPKRCKPNELMNNINCPNSNSGDFDEDKLLKAEMDDRESLVTTVKQDVEANSKYSPILAPTEYEPKPKTCKPNELMNNINCPNSNSGDFDEDKLLNCFITHKAEIDDRESLVTTVKQDVETNSKYSPILAPTEYEPKPKTCKPNELMNNINCPNTNSGDFDEDKLLSYFITHKAEMDDSESLVTTVKQDVEANSKCSPILTPTEYEPKPKTCKPNELINNINCPNSNSGDFDEDKVLNYFITHKAEMDELIEELIGNENKNCEEANPKMGLINEMKSIQINKEHKEMEINSINKRNENYSNNNEETKKKEGDLNNHVNMKAIEIIQEEEKSLHKSQVNNNNEKKKPNFTIELCIKFKINSEDEDTNLEIESISNTNKQNLDQSSKVYRNTQQEANKTTDITDFFFEKIAPNDASGLHKHKLKFKSNSQFEDTEQQANTIIDVTGKAYEEIAPKETMILSNDEQKIRNLNNEKHTEQEANNITDLTRKAYVEIAPKETMSLFKDEKKIITNFNNEKHPEQEPNNITDLTRKPYVEIAPKETITLCRDEQKIITNLNNEKHTQQEAKNIIDLSRKAHVKITPKETMSLCKDKQKIIANIKNEKHTEQEANNIIDLTGIAYVEIMPKETMSLCNDEKKIITNSKYEKLTNHEENNITDLTGEAYGENTPKEAIDLSDDSNDSIVEVIDITDATSKHLQPTVNRQYGIRKHIELNQGHGYAKQSYPNSIQKSVNVVEEFRETLFNDAKQQDINMNIENPTLSTQLINKEKDVVKTAQVKIETRSETIINVLDHNKKMNKNLIIDLSDETDEPIKIALESQESVNQILPETTKHGIKMDAEIKTDPLNVPNIQRNLSEKSGFEIVPLCSSDKTLKDHKQIFEDTVNKPANKPINNTEKKTQNVLSSVLCENELLLGSETLETAISSSVQNKEEEGEVLQKSESLRSYFQTFVPTIDNMSDKNILPNTDKNREDTSEETSTVKAEKITANYKELITTITKSDVKNQVKSLETVKNNPQKLKTTEDTVSKAKNSNIKIKNKENELEISEIFTNTKKEQEQIGANNSMVPTGRNKIYETNNIQEQPTMSQLESRMSEFLKEKYTLSSLIHPGRFSRIYKCFDNYGRTYALKVVDQRKKGKFMEGIFSLLQKQIRRQASNVLYLMSAFECQNRWCLLTEYFPKNLAEVLHENKRSFHIDEVQVFSRQLVDAVQMLTNAGIIHSDIKPAHILINRADYRLKLCGFDRSNFSSNIKIMPNTGTTKYRAPEIILGFQEDHRIDVWSTALVIFEMATNKSLFDAFMNNEVLYQHLSTFRIFDWSMVAQARYRALHFSGTTFIRQLERNGREKINLNSLQRKGFLRRTLFESYYQQWTWGKSKWQIAKETHKLETLHTLLEQMLALDPRNRLPIQFVNASEFMNYKFTIG